MRIASELRDLVKAVAGKDEAAFKALYDDTSPKVLSIILRILHRRAPAEDVLAYAYEHVWRSAEQLLPEMDSPAVAIATIARHRAIEIARRKILTGRDMPESVFETPDPDARREFGDDLRRVLNRIGELEPEGQKLILLAYYNGWSLPELAKNQDVSSADVRAQLRNYLQQLSEGLVFSDAQLPEHQTMLAAEYSVGVLDIGERLHAEAMIQLDPRFRQRAIEWDRQLGTLNQMGGLVSPSPHLWWQIKQATGLDQFGQTVNQVKAVAEPEGDEMRAIAADPLPGTAPKVSVAMDDVAIHQEHTAVASAVKAPAPAQRKRRPILATLLLLIGLLLGAIAIFGLQLFRPDINSKILQDERVIRLVNLVNPDYAISTSSLPPAPDKAVQPDVAASIQGPQHVALLYSIRDQPAFILLWREGESKLSIRRLTDQVAEGHQFQLWLIVDGQSPPVPVAGLKGDELSTASWTFDVPTEVMKEASLGVSVEAEGQQSSEPLLQFKGRFVKVAD